MWVPISMRKTADEASVVLPSVAVTNILITSEMRIVPRATQEAHTVYQFSQDDITNYHKLGC
jgi:hypothetical protein